MTLQDLIIEWHGKGVSREEALSRASWCGCQGCMQGLEDGKPQPPCACGMKCHCRCTLPAAVQQRAERRAEVERLVNEVFG